MTFIASVLLLALTRAEIIERFKAPPVIKMQGLLQVVADCPADMRREYQLPVSSFAADICERLYRASGIKGSRFMDPGIVIYIGDVRTNMTDVVARRKVRADGSRFTRIFLPAPGFSDVERLRVEVTKAFFLAVVGVELDDEAARKALRESEPGFRTEEKYRELERWLRGERTNGGDEEMMKLQRSVLQLGVARVSDVLRFASRLYLYPETYSAPFCGNLHCCTFMEAIDMSRVDPRIRFIALDKAPSVVAFGCGRGEALSAAAEAYSNFLRELAVGKRSADEMRNLLDDADVKLNIAMEEARKREEGMQK